MTTPVAAKPTRMTRALWVVLWLLVISIFINYADRSNLSLAATPLKGELGLSETQVGLLLSAFFWSYALFQLFGFAGWLVHRFDVSVIYALGFLMWSGATAATGLANGLMALFVLRLVLGIGESIAYPSYSQLLAVHIPEHHRGLANALIDAGSKLGPALGTLIGGVLIARYGWRPVFVFMGVISFAWLLPWVKWMPRQRPAAPAAHAADTGPGILEIVRQRSAWGTFLGLFCANYYWYFLLTYLPRILVADRHFSIDKMAVFGSAAYFAIAVSSTFNGWFSDRLIAAGYSTTVVRKGFTTTGLALSTIIMAVAFVQNENLAMVFLMIACVAFGIFSCSHWAITQTLAGPSAAGRWTSLQNGVGNLAGVAAPWLTGWVKDATGSFFWAFAVTAAILVIGALSFAFVIGPVREVEWRTSGPSRPRP